MERQACTPTSGGRRDEQKDGSRDAKSQCRSRKNRQGSWRQEGWKKFYRQRAASCRPRRRRAGTSTAECPQGSMPMLWQNPSRREVLVYAQGQSVRELRPKGSHESSVHCPSSSGPAGGGNTPGLTEEDTTARPGRRCDGDVDLRCMQCGGAERNEMPDSQVHWQTSDRAGRREEAEGADLSALQRGPEASRGRGGGRSLRGDGVEDHWTGGEHPLGGTGRQQLFSRGVGPVQERTPRTEAGGENPDRERNGQESKACHPGPELDDDPPRTDSGQLCRQHLGSRKEDSRLQRKRRWRSWSYWN